MTDLIFPGHKSRKKRQICENQICCQKNRKTRQISRQTDDRFDFPGHSIAVEWFYLFTCCAAQSFANYICAVWPFLRRKKSLRRCGFTGGAATINTNTQSLGSAAAALSFSSIAGRHHRGLLSPLLPQVPMPLPLPAAAACSRSRLSPPLTSAASRRRHRLHLIVVSASSSLPPPPRHRLAAPPRTQPSSQPLSAPAAIEHRCRHQAPAIFIIHCRRQTQPPAVNPPPLLPSITVFAAVALPPPRRIPSPRPSNARRSFSCRRPLPTP